MVRIMITSHWASIPTSSSVIMSALRWLFGLGPLRTTLVATCPLYRRPLAPLLILASCLLILTATALLHGRVVGPFLSSTRAVSDSGDGGSLVPSTMATDTPEPPFLIARAVFQLFWTAWRSPSRSNWALRSRPP